MPGSRRTAIPDDQQLVLPLYPLRNSEFLSNHWLEHRLCLEPEWREYAQHAQEVMGKLMTLWKAEKDRVALYGDEAGLNTNLFSRYSRPWDGILNINHTSMVVNLITHFF